MEKFLKKFIIALFGSSGLLLPIFLILFMSTMLPMMILNFNSSWMEDAKADSDEQKVFIDYMNVYDEIALQEKVMINMPLMMAIDMSHLDNNFDTKDYLSNLKWHRENITEKVIMYKYYYWTEWSKYSSEEILKTKNNKVESNTISASSYYINRERTECSELVTESIGINYGICESRPVTMYRSKEKKYMDGYADKPEKPYIIRDTEQKLVFYIYNESDYLDKVQEYFGFNNEQMNEILEITGGIMEALEFKVEGNIPYNLFPLLEFITPIHKQTALTSHYGVRYDPFGEGELQFHLGTDYANADNTPIYSIYEGRVVTASTHLGFGNYVVIEHEVNNSIIYSLYAHMNKITVENGHKVTTDTKLGLMGNTGRSTGTHLHLEIYYMDGTKKISINPYLLINQSNKRGE